MNQSQTLKLLIEQAERNHREAQGRLGQAQRQLGQAMDTDAMLRQYRQEQQRQRAPRAGQLSSGQEQLVLHGFGRKLDQAIDQQGQAVARQERHADEVQEQVKSAAIRLRSMERLVQLRQARQQQRQLKSEQRSTDERAGQMAARRKST